MARRIAKGEIVPNRVTGMVNRISTAINEPANTPTWSWSKASRQAEHRPGCQWYQPGTLNAPQARILYKSGYGERSAHHPPME